MINSLMYIPGWVIECVLVIIAICVLGITWLYRKSWSRE